MIKPEPLNRQFRMLFSAGSEMSLTEVPGFSFESSIIYTIGINILILQ